MSVPNLEAARVADIERDLLEVQQRVWAAMREFGIGALERELLRLEAEVNNAVRAAQYTKAVARGTAEPGEGP